MRRNALGFAAGLFLAAAPWLAPPDLFCPPARAESETAPSPLAEGERLFREGRFEEAAARLKEALDAAPDSLIAKQALANSLAALGHKALKEGRWTDAKKNVEKAIDLWPQEANFHLLLGVLLYRQGDFYYSRYAIKKALELDPKNSQAHELLGDLLYQDGYLDLAIPEWEASLAGSRNPGMVKMKMEKAEKEMDVEQTYNRDVSRHFILQLDGEVPRWMIQTVLRDLEEAYDLLRKELGISPPGDITVILYSGQDFRAVTRSPAWVGGTFDGKIRLPVGGLTEEYEARHLKPTLTHELTHAFLRSMVPQGLPIWLNEGLAEYFEGMNVDMVKARLAALTDVKVSSLMELGESFRRGNIEAAYFLSFLAVHTLVEEEGFYSVRRMLEDMGAGSSLPAAFQEEFRMTMEEFQEKWLRSLS